MNRRVSITFNQYPCYENIFLCSIPPARLRASQREWKFQFSLSSRPRRRTQSRPSELSKTRPSRKLDEFWGNNDMQKYRIKNQFIVESSSLRLSTNQPSHTFIGRVIHFYFLVKEASTERKAKRVECLSLMVFHFPSFLHRYCSLFALASGRQLIYGHEFN